jgi:hypothetical protein
MTALHFDVNLSVSIIMKPGLAALTLCLTIAWTPRVLSLNALMFQDGAPGPRSSTSTVPSACANGGGWDGDNVAFACPHMAMLTDDMTAAARYDGLAPEFIYGVAGGSSDTDCGICYQIMPLEPERHWRDDFPLLVIQVINSGWDVLAGQFDLFVGAGGMGYFTAVNSDCASRYCRGGPCRRGMYDGDFEAWTDAEFSDPHVCYEGGVKWDNISDIWERCRRLSGGSDELKDRILWDSCARTNLEYLHQNWYETRYERVACPEGLARLTGLWRSDDENYPLPHASNPLTQSCQGSIESGHACLTTMHDGCVPSCSWLGKVDARDGYLRVDRCDANGNVV